MAFKAAFAETDITPPVGTLKIGWIKRIVSDKILDPLFARVALFDSGDERIAFVQLDTLSIRWTQVADLRRRIEEAYGFPGAHIMVCCTHNHAGPAVSSWVDFDRDEAYIERLTNAIVAMFGEALGSLQDAQLGFGTRFEFEVAYNRRVVMRDGTTRTHGTFNDPNALYVEGPIDPEVAVLAARTTGGELLGCLTNFSCHPTHHGGTGVLSAGYPGVLANEMKTRGCPVTLFINGAAGNLHTSSPAKGRKDSSMERVGRVLADDVSQILESIEYRESAKLGSKSATLQLPFRQITDDEIKGTVRGAQRFVDPTLYDKGMPHVLEKIRRMGTQPTEIQVQFIDEIAVVGVPAEYFVQPALRIKEETHPRHTLVAGFTNGMIGYVPHRAAFARGGYETTFGIVSRLAPEAGDLIADCAIEQIREGI